MKHIYGIAPKQVIGNSVKTASDIQDDRGVLIQLPEVDLVDDGPRIYIHRDDADWEFADDQAVTVGRPDRGVDQTMERDGIVVSTRENWKQILL